VDWRSLRWILLASFALNVIPVWWGLPAIWPPDELTPGTVLRAFAEHFSHGWFDRWPPLHYYVLTAALSPALVLDAFGRIDFATTAWGMAAALVGRAVSLAAAAGTLIAVAIVASRVLGRRAGMLAAAIFALALPFPYYAKTANLDVPYVFWFAVSFVFYVRLLDAPRTRDAVAFAVCATFAVCTKDQAYALYPLMALAIAVRVWRARRAAGLPSWRLLFDPRILAGVATAVVVFAACHNLLFNWSGFREHVR
jgi:4-amino-4-deoxy-L-arabinose transferase-like glycosyltransferase